VSRQAIKYQGTTVEAIKSAGEIQRLVQQYGGTRCEIRWDTKGNVVGVRFAIRHERFGEVPVRLAAKTAKIEEILKRRTSIGHEKRPAQAYRIAWRQLKDFVEQALLAVETGLFPLHEAFMASVETEDPETGESITWGEMLERHGAGGVGGLRLLGSGPKVIEAVYTVEAP
jgi:hypothetical protein